MAKTAVGETPDTVVHTVTVPVGSPIGCEWAELNAALTQCWRLSTYAANWCVQQLYRRDTVGVEKTPGAVKPRGKNNPGGYYSYGEYLKAHPTADADWRGAKQSLNICLRYAERKYRDCRWNVMVRHEQNLLTVRYPFPYPVDADGWTPSYDDGGFPVVTLSLPGLGRVALRLKRRADFGLQLAMFKQLHDGTAKKGEAALYRNRKGDLLLKLVGHFPRGERGPAANVAFVHTDPNAMLVVEINGRAANVTNADHIRRHIARHKTMLQRTGEDKKRELRMDSRQRKNLEKHVGDRCEKQRNRMDTYVKQVAAQVAKMCDRQGVGTVAYDDTNTAFMPDGFPWHALKTRLRQLLEGEGSCGWIDGQFAHLNEEGGKEEWLRQAQATLSAARKVSAHKSRPRGKSHPAVSTTRETSSGSAGR
jgi:hypothetical protein